MQSNPLVKMSPGIGNVRSKYFHIFCPFITPSIFKKTAHIVMDCNTTIFHLFETHQGSSIQTHNALSLFVNCDKFHLSITTDRMLDSDYIFKERLIVSGSMSF